MRNVTIKTELGAASVVCTWGQEGLGAGEGEFGGAEGQFCALGGVRGCFVLWGGVTCAVGWVPAGLTAVGH